MAAGSIIIDLLLRTGSFGTDTDRAAKDLAKLRKEALATAKQFGDTFAQIAGSLGITLSLAGLTALIKSSIDAADHLNDLSKSTGIAVQTLGGLGFAARQAGSDLDSTAQAMGRLNLRIAGAVRGDKADAALFKALGISVTDTAGKARIADDIFADLADRFQSYAEGPEKAALGNAFFDRSYQRILPLLDEGGESLRKNIAYFKQFSGVTDDLTKASDEFNDTLEKVKLLSSSFGNTLANELLPLLKTVADELVDAGENTNLFAIAAAGVRVALEALVLLGANIAFVFKGVGREIGGIAAQLAALATLDFDGFSAISDAMKEDAQRARKELDAFEQRIIGGAPKVQLTTGDFTRADRRADAANAPKGRAPAVPDVAGSEAELKKRLEGQLKVIREFGQQRAQAFQFADRYLDAVYADGIVSQREFFDAQRRVRDEALAAQVDALNKEIAAQSAAAKKLTGADRIDLENKVADAVARRSAAVLQASQADTLAAQQEAREVKALRDSYDDLRAKVLELSGDTAGAAGIRNAKAIEDARKLITQAGGDPALAGRFAELTTQTSQLTQVQRDYNQLLEQARTEEERLLLIAQQSGATETQTLQAIGAAREKSLQQLGALAQRAQVLADTLKTPEAVLFAEQLANAFKRAQLEVDPLLTKIRDAAKEMGDSIANGFEDALLQGKSLREMLKGIYQDITRIVTRKLITEPFADALTKSLGGTGSSGGILGSLFGIGSAALGGAGAGGSAAAAGAGGAADATAAASRSINALAGDAAAASAAVVQMGDAANQGGSSLGLLPSIIASIQAAFASTSATSGGAGGLAGLFGSLFGGGSGSAASSADLTTAFHDGGVVGRDLQPGAEGGPGTLRPNERRAVLKVGEEVLTRDDPRHRDNGGWGMGARRYHEGGIVDRAVAGVYGRSTSPSFGDAAMSGRGGEQRPIQLFQTFAAGTTRATTDQAAASAGAAVRKAVVRTR